ncbi:DDE-type integrase/transposase/recombinase [Tunturiibacter gelidiferens]|uniref:DDE-type integrase/transposase/recombinase n=1 Tax=Tunturiibacter gelidiferens TaxID=3069689 RepID=UPI003D9B475B
MWSKTNISPGSKLPGPITERFFRKLLRGQGAEPLQIITDKLRSYTAAMRSIFSNVTHRVERYANNRVEASHQPTRQRERQMRRFKSARHATTFSLPQ